MSRQAGRQAVGERMNKWRNDAFTSERVGVRVNVRSSTSARGAGFDLAGAQTHSQVRDVVILGLPRPVRSHHTPA